MLSVPSLKWTFGRKERERLRRTTEPFLIQGVLSGVTFNLGLAATQAAGRLCKISCANFFLAPALGTLGVGLSAIASGQVSSCFTSFRSTGKLPSRNQVLLTLTRDQHANMIVDLAFGLVMFRVLGGKLRNTLPSSLWFPGAIARESLLAKGAQYANEAQKAELKRLFKRYGCHHCGTRFGKVIGDHMPPNKVVHGAGSSTQFHRRWSKRKKQVQRFFPQCQKCSNLQGVAIRDGKNPMVLHFNGFRPFDLTGFAVGMRYHQYKEPEKL